MHIHHLAVIKHIFLFWCYSELTDPLWHICEAAVLSSTELTFSPEVATPEVTKPQYTYMISTEEIYIEIKTSTYGIKNYKTKQYYIGKLKIALHLQVSNLPAEYVITFCWNRLLYHIQATERKTKTRTQKL